MKHGLVLLALLIALPGAAYAGPQPSGRLSITEPAPKARPALNFRLVRDSEFDPDPIHNSGMIAQTEIAPNATVGFGLLKAAPKKRGSGEWKLDDSAPRSRKAAVSLRIKF